MREGTRGTSDVGATEETDIYGQKTKPFGVRGVVLAPFVNKAETRRLPRAEAWMWFPGPKPLPCLGGCNRQWD